MRNNDRLLYEIGELDDVPAIVKEKKKVSRVTWAAVGSAAAAAAVAGFVILRGTGTAKMPWEDYQIYSPADYSKEVIIDELPKIPYELKYYVIYWDEAYEARAYLYTASDIENSAVGNPWSEETELTSLPVFKNKSPDADGGVIPAGIRCLTEEQLTQMLDNTVKALGITVSESSFDYINWDTGENEDLPIWLNAECSGEEYGVNPIYIGVNATGSIHVNFLNSLKLPDEYIITDPDNEQKEKILSYLADRFKNLLQFENPVLSTENDKYSGYKVYNGSENIVESIVNYNLASASFLLDEEGLYKIRLGNLLCISDYMGDYPVISLERARELLLSGSYLKRFPDSFLKGGAINEEDIAKAELIYLNGDDDEYFKPYYRFYVEIDSSSLEYYDDDGQPLTLYGDVYVPAVESKYILSSENEHILTPDYSGTAIKSYPENEIGLPDSSVVSKNEAVRTYRDNEMPVLEFNFGFLRYAKPVFQNSIDDPDCYNEDTLKFNAPVDIVIDDPDYFKVKAGDVLENGMTVDSANYKVMWKNEKQTFVESEVTISGEAVYEGILMCRKGEDYAEDVYDLVFYADPTGENPLPVFCSSGDGSEQIETWVRDDFALMTDCGPIFLTNTDSYIAEMEGYSEILGCDRGIKAKLTLNKIIFTVNTIGDFHAGYTYAAYKDLEILE